MRIPRIFIHQPLSANTAVVLSEDQSHYLNKVLRMQLGRELIAFDGRGGEYAAEIVDISKKAVTIQTRDFQDINKESPLELSLAIGVSRGERMDWVLQKATELGVTHIIPLITERTEVKLGGERSDKKMEHWQQILISSCEQCQRNTLPSLSDPQEISKWLPNAVGERKFVLHHRDNKGLPSNAQVASATLLIGPEGGLSDDEIQLAINQGFDPLTLGPRVLRTETAPVAAISLVQYLWGDL